MDLSNLSWEDLVKLTQDQSKVMQRGPANGFANPTPDGFEDWTPEKQAAWRTAQLDAPSSIDASGYGMGNIRYNGEKFVGDVAGSDRGIEYTKSPTGGVNSNQFSRNHGWLNDKIEYIVPAMLAAIGGAGAYGAMGAGAAGAGAGVGAGEAGAAAGGGGLLGGGGGASIAAMTPEAAYAGGLASSNAAVAGMGGASGIGSAGGALSVAGAGQAAASGGGGLLGGGGGGNSISAMTPQEVYAGGQASANGAVSGMGTPASIGQAGGALSVAPNYLGMAKNGLSAAKSLSGALGGVGQGQGGGGGMANGTTQSQIDPRMAKYIYGDESNQGILDIAQKMYQSNPSGMNAQMVQGMNNQWNTLNDPKLKAGYDQIQNQGLGLLNMPMAGNPFTRGQTSAQPAGIPAYQVESLPNAGLLGASPFSLMGAGKATINPDMLKAYMGGNFTNRGQ